MSAGAPKRRFTLMSEHQLTRRELLAASSRVAAAGLLTLYLPWLAALASCARDDARGGRPFERLTSDEARTLRAFAARIIPSDDTPGADEAGAVHFIERALAVPFFAHYRPLITAGSADLDLRASALGARKGFSTLSVSRQIALMRDIEHTEFFAAARTLVVMGTFADPSHGGNQSGLGWTMIGIDHRPSYAPPFGWYDAPPGVGT